MYYVCKDRQGSITALLRPNGTVAERYSYDAWGRRRNPNYWNDYKLKTSRLISRGYTGHEHLDGFGLINMNGRMYDPVIGRVLSPDAFVQDPTNTQSYNRFSYCMNNPLKYTDPSGWRVLAYDFNGFCGTGVFGGEGGGGREAGGGGGGAGGYTGTPGSGTHWSDQFRTREGNYFLMNESSFNDKYGDGAYVGMHNNIGNLNSQRSGYWEEMNSTELVGETKMLSQPGAENKYAGAAGPVIGLRFVSFNNMQGSGSDVLSSPRDFANELKYFYKYNSDRDYHLSQDRFKDVYNQAHDNNAIQWNKVTKLVNGNYSIPVNFYKTDYDVAFGRATMYFSFDKNNGFQPIGFYDLWDLNPKPWGTRSNTNEIITRYYNWKLNGGTPFKVIYP